MPLVDPEYRIGVNPNDGFRRSWDPFAKISSLIVDDIGDLTADGRVFTFNKALLLPPSSLSTTGKIVNREVVPLDPPIITAVNSNLDVAIPSSGEITYVTITGSGFGSTMGLVNYGGIPLGVANWADNKITVSWSRLPEQQNFNGDDLRINQQYDLTVTRADNVSTVKGVTSVVGPGEWFGVIRDVGSDYSWFKDDTFLEAGDEAYAWLVSGTVVSVDPTNGTVSGATPNTAITYTVYDISGGIWLDPVTETYNAA